MLHIKNVYYKDILKSHAENAAWNKQHYENNCEINRDRKRERYVLPFVYSLLIVCIISRYSLNHQATLWSKNSLTELLVRWQVMKTIETRLLKNLRKNVIIKLSEVYSTTERWNTACVVLLLKNSVQQSCFEKKVGWRIVKDYCTPGIFRGMYISRLSMKPEFSRLKFRGWRLSKIFCVFRALLHGYVSKMYATILSEIDKTLSIIVEAILDLPMASLGNRYCHWWANQSGPITSPCLTKNNVQMHEMTRSTWPTVVSYFLKPTT